MAYPAERSRVMPAAAALALLVGCGSITGVSPSDGAALSEAGADAALPDAASPDAVPDVVPDVDTRRCVPKINEVQTGGTLAALDEFIELFNPCADRALALAGYSLVYRAEAGTTNVLLLAFGAQAVPANRPFFLCASSSPAYTGPTADAYYAASGLRDTGGGLALLDPAGQIADSVGWGTATNAFVEASAAPAPLAGQSIGRVPDGSDSDANASDFVVAALPTPGAPN